MQPGLDLPELMEFTVPILRANCQVCGEYRTTHRSAQPCPVTADGSIDDPLAR